jgi:hypothetical protein
MNEYFIYLKLDEEDAIISIKNDFNWYIKCIKGNDDIVDIIELDYQFDIDDVIEYLTNEYNYVEEISKYELDDYII